MVVPIIAAFFAGVGLLGAFNALNTYSAGELFIIKAMNGAWLTIYLPEAMPHARSETISCKYIVQYIFAAAATAAVEPLIGSIGVGWTFTICKFPAYIFCAPVVNFSDYVSRRLLCHHQRLPCPCYCKMGHRYAALV